MSETSRAVAVLSLVMAFGWAAHVTLFLSSRFEWYVPVVLAAFGFLVASVAVGLEDGGGS